jgi:hypothetical protein
MTGEKSFTSNFRKIKSRLILLTKRLDINTEYVS